MNVVFVKLHVGKSYQRALNRFQQLFAQQQMHTIDLVIVFGYLAAIMLLGLFIGRGSQTIEGYFLGGRNIAWWRVSTSIAATELGIVTLALIVDFVFAKNGGFQFLQFLAGYLLGRVIAAFFFVPLYFRAGVSTAYELLGNRLGDAVRMLVAALSLTARTIADAVRLLLAALIAAAVITTFEPLASFAVTVIAAIVVLGVTVIFYAYYGGIRAVICVETVQLAILFAATLAAILILIGNVNGGWPAAVATGQEFQKFDVLSLSFDLKRDFTLWAGIAGGCFFGLSAFGADQNLAQRYLSVQNQTQARAAILVSGALVSAQIIGFLLIGILLFAFYQPFNNNGYTLAASGSTFPFANVDRLLADFVVAQTSPGVAGLLLIAVLFGGLSSSPNSTAAVFVNDIYKPLRNRKTDKHLVRVARLTTFCVGLIQIALALAIRTQERQTLEQILLLALLAAAPVFGLLIASMMLPRMRAAAAVVGMTAGFAVMFLLKLLTPLAWTWFALVGVVITVLFAWPASLVFRTKGIADDEQNDAAT